MRYEIMPERTRERDSYGERTHSKYARNNGLQHNFLLRRI
jgi:hypothetical protein